jgi:SAM-dependent methyltransferase
MNRLENWFCSSGLWRRISEKQILPWLLSDANLGSHVLEVGAGAGAGTRELQRRAARVTSLEYDHRLARKLAARYSAGTRAAPDTNAIAGVTVVQGDAALLPFPAKTFSAVVAVLMLHHLPSSEAQDRAFAEIARVLQPEGHFYAFDIPDGWFQRLSHWRSTFVPLQPSTVTARLARAGLSDARVDIEKNGYRVRARRNV